MNVEAQKLNIIERFMKFKEESAIQEIEKAITRVELNKRADNSISDIEEGRYRSYEGFNTSVKEWIKSRKATK